MASVNTRIITADGKIQTILMQDGWTISQLLDEVPNDYREQLSVYNHGQLITDPDSFRVQAGDNLLVCVELQGGKGIGALLSIGLAIVAPYMAGAALTAVGGTSMAFTTLGTATFANMALSAGISFLGNMLISALVAPSSVSTNSGGNGGVATYSITGQQNAGRAYQQVYRIYGRHKLMPALASAPIFNNVGKTSQIFALYDFGLGWIELSELKIGEAYPSAYGAQIITYTNSLVPSTQWVTGKVGYEQLNYKLLQSQTMTMKTKANSYMAVVDLQMPKGLYFIDSNGKNQGIEIETIQFNIQYRKVGDSAWIPTNASQISFGGLVGFSNLGGGSFSATGILQFPFTINCTVYFPTDGQYEFAITRQSRDSSGNSGYTIIADLFVVLLKSFIRGKVVNLNKKHTMVEMNIIASDKISGLVQNLNAIGTSVLRTTTDGVNFLWVATRNPAWIAIDILTGEGNPRPLSDDNIDWATWINLANYCDEPITRTINGVVSTHARHTADFVVDYVITVKELLESLLSGCRSSLIINQAGKYGVMADQEKTIPRQLITPENSWNFSGERSFNNGIHALRVGYVDGEIISGVGYGNFVKQEVMVYNDGYNANNSDPSKIESLGTFGITDYASAWSYGRYMIAQGVIRQEHFTVTLDIENLVATRGDLIYLAHDVPMIGGIPSRVVSVNGNNVAVSIPLSVYPQSYTVRQEYGDIRTGNVVAAVAANEFTFDSATGINEGDLIVLGSLERVTEPYLIQQIQASNDLTATLLLVKYDPAVYTADTKQIPDWVPDFGGNFIDATDITVINAISTNKLIYINRYPRNRFDISWNVTGFGYQSADIYFIKNNTRVLISSVNGYSYVLDIDAYNNPSYIGSAQVEISPVSATGVVGISEILNINIIEDTTPPSEVLGFGAHITNNQIDIFWDFILEPDIDYYEVRYSPDVNGVWELSQALALVDYKTQTVAKGARTGRYFIQAVDTSGNKSVVSSQRTMIEALPNIDFVIDINDAPVWGGLMENVSIVEGEIKLGHANSYGYYYFKDTYNAGVVEQIRLSSKIYGHADDSLNVVAYWGIMASVGILAGSIITDDWNDGLEYRVTSLTPNAIDTWLTLDSPLADPIQGSSDFVFGAWHPFQTADVTGQYMQFRAKLERFKDTSEVYLTSGLITIDVNERREYRNDLFIPNGGAEVLFDFGFKNRPTLAITIESSATAIRYEISNATNKGFIIKLLDASDADASGSIDVAALGYGKQNNPIPLMPINIITSPNHKTLMAIY